LLPEVILDCLQPELNREAVRLAVHPETSYDIKQLCYRLATANDMATCKAFFTQLTWATEQEWKSLKEIPVLIVQGKEDCITTVGLACLFMAVFIVFMISLILFSFVLDNALKLYEEIQDIGLMSESNFVDKGLYSFKVVDKAGMYIAIPFVYHSYTKN